MDSTTLSHKLAAFFKEEARSSIADSCEAVGFATGFVISRIHRYWNGSHPVPRVSKQRRFDQELSELLQAKLHDMDDTAFPAMALAMLSAELFKLFACALASNRTPNEIADGLSDDAEMRSEVISLILSEGGAPAYQEEQRVFLQRLLSGDHDLRILLSRQTERTVFPHRV